MSTSPLVEATTSAPESIHAVPLIWLTGIAALLTFAGIAWALAPLYPGVVALELAFTPRSFATIVHAWPPAELGLYRSCLQADFLLLGCYGAFGYLLVSRTALFARQSRLLRTAVAWALPVAALLGAAENGLHLWLTEVPRFGVPLLYAIPATCATARLAILSGFAAAVVHVLTRDEG